MDNSGLRWYILLSLIITQVVSTNPDMYLGCYNKYTPDADPNNYAGPFRFMGRTFDKKFWISSKRMTLDFAEAVEYCSVYGYELAKLTTDCELYVLNRWFKFNYKVTDSAWIAGLRWGASFEPHWVTTGETMDTQSTLQMTPDNLPNKNYWDNCLTVVRTCPPKNDDDDASQNSCNQTNTSPDVRLQWDDCRIYTRVICQKENYNYDYY